ncbi:MAG: hypothetical protein KDA28_01695, partial [Phycisphaerales bacterium]|nr:hypothetical protein [Phycisphaerales bacterium]
SVLHARTFFDEEGTSFVAEDADLAALHASAKAGTIGSPGDAGHDAYMDRYLYLRSVYIARRTQSSVETVDGVSMDPDALLSLFRIEQWDRSDPNRPKPMRRVLGAIVDVGVEYFATVPGALGAETSHRKVLESFVRSVDALDFEAIAIDEEPLARLMSGLLVSALETIGTQPELLSGDVNVQDLVRVTSTALAQDIATALEGKDGFTSDSIRAWGDLVFRSVLRSGGMHVLERPGVFLGVEGEPRQALVSRVGGAALRLVLEHDHPRALFSSEGLDALISAALLVVADHPELVVDTNNKGIEGLVSSLARDLGSMDRVVDLGLVPDIAQRVLIRTGEHLDLIWPDLDPRRHLLLTAAKVVLHEVSQDPPDGSSWTPRFGRDEILAVVDAVMDELVSNPAWLLALADDADAMLGDVLRAILGVLREGGDERLSPSTAAAIVRA